MADAHYIVKRLGEPPFNVYLDLIGFSEKTPQQLLELLVHVCGAISPKHATPEGGGPEHFDALLRRVLGFLRVVKYQPREDAATFQELLAAGDRDAVLPVLRWLLAQEPMLRKRAYVGHYLTMPEVPDDLAYDPAVADLKAAIRELHPGFIEAHKAAEAARALAGNAAALRSRVKELGAEKERLREKVAAARARLAGLPHAEAYAGVCTALRQQHDEEVAISDALAAQAQGHARAEAAAARAAAALAKASAAEGGAEAGDGAAVVARLQDEVARLRQQVDERAPREIEARQRRLAELRDALSVEVGGEAGLQQLASQAGALQHSVAEVSARLAAAERARQADRSYLQVRQAHQMAAMVAKRRADLEARLDRLARAREALAAALGGDGGGGGGRGGGADVTDAQWRAKYNAVKAQLGPVKQMRKELAALEAEAAVLARTEAVLAAQAGEEPAGPPGEAGAGQQPGAGGAEDLAALRGAIAARKAELAPKVQELRVAREALQAAEARLTAAREARDAAVGPLEARCAALEAEVAGLEADEKGARAALAEAEAAAAALGDSLARLAAESGSPERLRERSEQRVAQAEAGLRALKEQHRALAAAAARAHSQRAVFAGLAGLLRAKLAAAEDAASGDAGHGAGGGAGGYGGSASANVAVF